MSFQDVGHRGASGAPPMASRPRPSAATLAAKQKQKNEKELSGLLYGKLKLVPSSSYETAESEQIGSLEFSSCSESLSGRSLPSESSPSSPLKRGLLPSGAAAGAALGKTATAATTTTKTTTDGGSPSRGIAGFSTHRRGKNSVAQSNTKARAPLQPRGWTEVDRSSSNNTRHEETIQLTGASSQEGRGTSTHVHKENSKFSELNTEIKHFSKMVTQLETLLQQCAESPEVQWRARILSRSAQEADRDIADKLYWYEKSLVDKGRKKEARTSQTACMKLHRDFRRAHKALDEALCEYEKRQRADISLLGASAVADQQQQDGSSSLILQQEQEDFFERATREREAEIRNINHKMHKVNEIYKELAVLVDSQQEQIDVVQENVQDAKDTVEGGLRHIEYARDRLCAMGGDGDGSYEPQTCGGGFDDVADGDPATTNRRKGGDEADYDRLYPSSVGESEIFHWSMPFQTFHKDIKAVQKDILGLGNDIASLRLPENMGACGSLDDIQCGGTKKDAPSVVGSAMMYNEYDDDDSL